MDAHALATNVGACMRWILAGRSVDRWHASIIVGEVRPTDSSLSSTPNHLLVNKYIAAHTTDQACWGLLDLVLVASTKSSNLVHFRCRRLI